MQRTDPVSAPSRSTPAPSTRATSVRRRSRGRGLFLIADSYLFRQVAGATMRGLLWFAGLLLIVAVMTAVRQVAKQSLSFSGMIELIALQMPRILVFTLPMSVLFGTVQTFGEMSGRGEIIALWAGGMSFKRMLRAPLLWGVVLSLIAFFIQEILVPGAETRRAGVVATQLRSSLGKQDNFSLRDPARGPLRKVIQAQRFDPETNVLTEPSIQIYRELKPYLLITAQRAQWDKQANSWILFNGKTIRLSNDRSRSGFGESGNFPRLDAKAKGYNMPSPDEMNTLAKTPAEHLESGDFEMVSIADLSHYRAALRDQLQQPQNRGVGEVSGRQKLNNLIRGATYGIVDKIATPLVCIALILVGAPLGIRPQRSSGGGFSLGISLMAIMLYYVTWSALSPLGKSGSLDPYLAALLAPVVTAIIGLVLVWKKNR